MNFVEVWNASTQPLTSQFVTAPIVVGISLIVLEGVALYSRGKWGETSPIFIFLNFLSHPRYPLSKIFFPLGAISIIIGIAAFISIRIDVANLSRQLETHEFTMIEGKVIVESEQPESGHTGGDIIHIGKYTFEINYFVDTHYYHASIAHGGVLSSGNYVKVYFVPTSPREEETFGDGKILRIEQVVDSDGGKKMPSNN